MACRGLLKTGVGRNGVGGHGAALAKSATAHLGFGAVCAAALELGACSVSGLAWGERFGAIWRSRASLLSSACPFGDLTGRATPRTRSRIHWSTSSSYQPTL